MNEDRAPKLDAAQLIRADLARVRRERQRHFRPALGLGLVALVALLAMVGLRPDLLAQPWWRLAGQVLAWGICLFAFPAIGVGLWFPGRWMRLSLAVLGVTLSVWTATSASPSAPSGALETGACPTMLGGAGVLLLALGALSGAFGERRARSAAFWIAAGIGLAGLELVTWVCPQTERAHLLQMHLLPAAGLVVVAAGVGVWLHGRARSSSAAPRL